MRSYSGRPALRRLSQRAAQHTRCLGRTETDRKITSEPWSSKQSSTEPIRPLFGVHGVVCPKKEKREQKIQKNFLTRAGIVRDVRFGVNQACGLFPSAPSRTHPVVQGR